MIIAEILNSTLEKSFGVRVKRVKPRHVIATTNRLTSFKKVFNARLLEQPVFIFSSIRSGSTLLSSILNAHHEICSPPETHFSRWQIGIKASKTTKKAIKELGLNKKRAQYILWDTILWRIREKSGKKILVEKTPHNVIKWEEIVECWPNAKIIFLLRHPVSVAQSWQDAKPNWPEQKVHEQILRYMNAVEEARKKLKSNSITVKYEDITAKPDQAMPKVCDFLEVEYEPEMLNYSANIDTESRYKRGIGDWTDKIKSGRIQKGRKLPKRNEIPQELEYICKAWGYIK